MASSDSAKDATPKKSRFARKPKDPSNPGRASQLKQVYASTKQQDPAIAWWMALAFLVVFGVFLLIGFAIGHPVYLGIIGLLFGLVAAMFIMGRRAERAAYKSIAGTPGATGAALNSLRRGWLVEQEPVAAEAGRARNVKDMSSAAMVFRAVGKPGVVLVGEGPKGSATKLLESERKRVARVAGPEVPVHTMRVGQGDGTVAVNELTKSMRKLPDRLTKDEVSAVTKRLRALGTAKPPVPQGIDPRKARMDRKAMRGR
ncbi:DUF4191 domain-containing protein [Luteipulveratus sp. YIM 133132]|uniref:DUF4191 domain-containing protein n=1 Tax=Luteipulveratus flavus TaxID=3031728 RepID=A0ABT6C5Q5_9MICO|nr:MULTISPECIES: DUF4191 domain-containing protein [unclassified Luteipulveratus]MDE9366451.1 DUF4191 domain-containing protein [Luteipulveratus sp. YIM 133132]MDF8264274.1 DUF4191 domain-containing protein [Luteipulveratus sp. YIM 133296]